jgi:hypothetical protein
MAKGDLANYLPPNAVRQLRFFMCKYGAKPVLNSQGKMVDHDQ